MSPGARRRAAVRQRRLHRRWDTGGTGLLYQTSSPVPRQITVTGPIKQADTDLDAVARLGARHRSTAVADGTRRASSAPRRRRRASRSSPPPPSSPALRSRPRRTPAARRAGARAPAGRSPRRRRVTGPRDTTDLRRRARARPPRTAPHRVRTGAPPPPPPGPPPPPPPPPPPRAQPAGDRCVPVPHRPG